MEYLTRNMEETHDLAARFVAGKLPCCCKKRDRATVVGLYGDLGAGKTSFTQGVAAAFGIRDCVTSPTFVLEKIYKLSGDQSYERLVHIDAYRLNRDEEMSQLGWEEIERNPGNIVFVEWPERVEGVLPKDMIKIYFETIGIKEGERKIKILC